MNPSVDTLERDTLLHVQGSKLQRMLKPVLESNGFYGRRLRSAGIKLAEDVRSLEDLRGLPLTTKAELAADQAAHPPYGTNLTFDRRQYCRLHQTSGTTSEPVRWLDTKESWNWWTRCWAAVYGAAGVTSADRIFFAFSFGPFIGFWSGFDAAMRIGALAIPGGGMSTYQRARAILANDVSVLVATPTYALHMAEVAEQEGIDIAGSGVRITIHAGEPGASVPATKQRIETAWGARCYDHAGATEVGAWGFECQAQAGLHINEGEFLAEVIDPVSGAPAEEGELVITNLGRIGSPVIRYRTGDHVKVNRAPCPCGCNFLRFDGGVIGRVDDAVIVRGINVFPSAIENIVRRFPEVGEFALDVYRRGELDQVEMRVEVKGAEPETVTLAVAQALRDGLGLRVDLRPVPVGTLPSFELKARRVADHRQQDRDLVRI